MSKLGPPVRPVDVLVLRRGEPPIICELVYRGVQTDADGVTCHVWSCPTHVHPEAGDKVSIGMMPALTGITFGEDDDE